nr:MAG TPA: Thaumarchaeal output domain 1 [Caudoviricetes sp.]
MWFCKCDCGSVAVISTNNLIQQTVSCGCVSRGPKIDDTVRAVCPGCGEKFDIELNGQKTPQFCPDCSRIYTGNS